MRDLEKRLKEMRVKGRDIYEVANQLGGYVGPGTDKRLADFLIREAMAASDLADEIVRLTTALEDASKVAEQVRRPVGAGDGGTYIPGTSAQAAAAIRALVKP